MLKIGAFGLLRIILMCSSSALEAAGWINYLLAAAVLTILPVPSYSADELSRLPSVAKWAIFF